MFQLEQAETKMDKSESVTFAKIANDILIEVWQHDIELLSEAEVRVFQFEMSLSLFGNYLVDFHT